MTKSQLPLRPMRFRDIPAGMRLKEIAGWNQTEADWRLLLASNPTGCFVAEAQGQIVGTITTTNYGGAITWIGMVLVDPDFRRQGVATQLTLRALETTQLGQTIKLDATSLGQQVYEPLGFVAEYTLYRLTVEAVPKFALSRNSVSALSADDMVAVGRLDRPVFGANRLAFLTTWAEAQPHLARQLRQRGQLHGYGLGRMGSNFYQLGPLIAETADQAIALAGSILVNLAGRPVVVDVPAIQADFLAWLTSLGFSQQRTFTRMYYHHNQYPGRPDRVFAAAGPEFG